MNEKEFNMPSITDIYNYQDHFFTHITNCYDLNISKLLTNELTKKITLSFIYDIIICKSYIVISNNIENILIQTPSIPIYNSNSNMVALQAANMQRIIDYWIQSIKEILEWELLTFYCKDITVTIKDTCFYGPYMFFFDNIINEDTALYIAHPYIIEKHPTTYKRIKQEQFDNNFYKEIPYEDYLKKHKEFVFNHYAGWQQKK